MYDSNSKGISYIAGFFMLIAFAVAGAIFASIINGFVWTSMTGKDVKLLADGIISPSDTNAIRVVQSIYAIVGFFLPTLLAASMLSRQPLELLGFSRSHKLNQVGMALLIMFLALFVSGFLSFVNHQIPIPASWKLFFDELEADYTRRVEAIVRLNDAWDFIIALIVMALLPAICEETLFRGGLQNLLVRSIRNPWIAILIVSLIFSIVHISFYGFLSRVFLGMVLGLIYHYSGKLWLCILAHFMNNALALLALFVSKRMGKSIEDMADGASAGWWGVFFVPLVIIAFRHFRKTTSDNRVAGANQ